ncbi:uncharacterized protein [Typha latifolia]|uniref:uncharacterized protein isoform X2 n=1 Tax=Typha latifolia TaxID=4733 RepID=UPI003C2AC2BD
MPLLSPLRRLPDTSPNANVSESSTPSSPLPSSPFLGSKTPSPSHRYPASTSGYDTTSTTLGFFSRTICCFGLSPRLSRFSFMAAAYGGGRGRHGVVPVVSSGGDHQRKKNLGMQERRLELEREVAELERILADEKKVHEVLEQALVPHSTRSELHIPSFLPKKAKELLAEVVMVEEEICRLEDEISRTQQGLTDMRKARVQETMKLEQFEQATLTVPNYLGSPAMVPHSNTKAMQGKLALDTKQMFFINQAMKGDYLIHHFSNERKKRNSVKSPDKKENLRAVENEEIISRRSGIIAKISSPKRPARHLVNKQSDAEMLLKFFQEPSTTANSWDKNHQRVQPNKLSERIMKCLICIFLRLIRTSRVVELEKSGNLARSSNSFLRTGSFRADGCANLNILQKVGQQDPYGIFEIEGSILRDLGPYKNLVRFTSSSLDFRCFSHSLPLLNKLRDLMNSLSEVDLRFLTHQQKLAFWINIYNICMMHGLLQHGLPSSEEKVLALQNEVMLNIGGNKLNASAIEHFILRQPSNMTEASWNYDNNGEEETIRMRNTYGLDQPEANIAFALCCGSRSSPAVKIYTADGVMGELEKSKLDYLQASLVVTTSKRLMIPSLVHSHMNDFAKDLGSLLDWICNQLPTSWSLRKSIVECLKEQNNGELFEIVHVIPYDSELQYLLPM